MAAEIDQFLCLKDNFGVLVHDPNSGATAAVDAPDAAPILAALAAKGWQLTDILITHHHLDHTQGIAGLLSAFPRARVIGPRKESQAINGLTLSVGEGDRLRIGTLEAEVVEIPGHTSGHVAYWLEAENLVFAGDTLFAMGCGRGFEEPAEVLYRSLQKLARLPPATKVYCGHEYTLANARFALSVDGGNARLRERFAEVARQRENGMFTLPTTIARELETNPFLRVEDPAIKSAIGMADAEPATVFAQMRERKNRA
jgi:hydroxyacylglutathione hydrolase